MPRAYFQFQKIMSTHIHTHIETCIISKKHVISLVHGEVGSGEGGGGGGGGGGGDGGEVDLAVLQEAQRTS